MVRLPVASSLLLFISGPEAHEIAEEILSRFDAVRLPVRCFVSNALKSDVHMRQHALDAVSGDSVCFVGEGQTIFPWSLSDLYKAFVGREGVRAVYGSVALIDEASDGYIGQWPPKSH